MFGGHVQPVVPIGVLQLDGIVLADVEEGGQKLDQQVLQHRPPVNGTIGLP